ncbi:MAG TPA: hypothetical protein VGN47_16500 [Blastococcus sp.]|nr:hypothetical protein [Blastococcus sp.]
MPTSDFPFGYRLLPDIASQIAATAQERRGRAVRAGRVHRLPWPRRTRPARDR